MLVKNNSEGRIIHIGNASILPGQTGEVGEEWRDSITSPDLEIIRAKRVVNKEPEKTTENKINPETGKEINPVTGLDIDPVTGKDIPAK